MAASSLSVAPMAERRVCSALSCDVVGFTPLSESRDPEAVRELLSRYFEVARTVIGRYGGVVEVQIPYHLAHGLLDHAEHLLRRDDNEAAEAAIAEARDIAHRLRCQPLLDRAADLLPAEPRIRARW